MSNTKRTDGVSLAKGPIAMIGLVLLAAGVLAFFLGDDNFKQNFPDGTARGDEFLGFKVNGWTAVLLAGSGLLLLLAAPLHWGAKTMGIIVGLILGAASVIALVDDQEDVLGLASANGPTKLLLGAAAAALLVFSLLPKVGKKEHDHDRDRDVAAPRRERVVEREVAPPRTGAVDHDRGHDHSTHDHGDREVVRDDPRSDTTERVAPDREDDRPLR